MAVGGKMTPKEAALLLLNRVAVKRIQLLGAEKELAFDKWFWRFTHRWRRLPGRTYFGAVIDCDLFDFIPKRIYFFGVWEPEVSKAITGELRRGDLFVDVGANIGYDTLLGRALVGPTGKVVAIEASQRNFLELSKNLERNGVTNVRVAKVAVSDREGELTLYSEETNQGRTSSTQRAGSKMSEVVKALPLDEILTPEERQKIRLVKIDIEGGEIPLLERLITTLDLYPSDMRLVVEMSNEDSGRSKVIFDALIAAGFKAYALSNDYTIGAYIKKRPPEPPSAIGHIPQVQTDILFKRGV